MKALLTTLTFILHVLQHRVCLFRKLTHFYCPGCGGTRAVRFLLRGDIVHSLIYHPAVPYTAFLAILYAFQLLVNHRNAKKQDGCGKKLRIIRPVFGYILIAIILIQWAVKNLLLLKGIDLLSIPLRDIPRPW